jgi:hypothetical protein
VGSSKDVLQLTLEFTKTRLRRLVETVAPAPFRPLNQLQTFHARMAVPTDDDMVVYFDAEAARCLDDPLRHLNIGT